MQRLFDVADEIDLEHAEKLVAGLSARRPLSVGSATLISMPDPPLEMRLPPRACGLDAVRPADVLVRVYNVGTIAVTFEITLPAPLAPDELIEWSARVTEAESDITRAARPIRDEIASTIAPACKPGEFRESSEEYTVFVLTETQPRVTGQDFMGSVDVARLLMGERQPIADQQRRQLTQAFFSYHPDDLVVLDWNSALVLDPHGNSEVPYLLELVGMQLVNLRSYDDIVGRALHRLYDELAGAAPRHAFWAPSRYQKLSRSIMRLFVDVADVTERIDNCLEFLGDTWLAGVHRAAVAEFDIPRWQRLLRHKLDVLQQINQQLVGQITTRRGLTAEYAIIALILIEIVMGALRLL